MGRIWDSIRYFFTSDVLSPHGFCLLWRPELIWTHAASDMLIGVAYMSIPLAMGVFLYHRRDVRFGWAIWMFVLFIMLCGFTHFMSIWTLWKPDYGLEALLKAATALASVVTAVALWPLLPKAVALPSPAALEATVRERDAALAELKLAMADMVEMRVHEAHQKLLLNELNHRVKNTLASVQAIAGQTLRSSDGLESAKATFMQRLMALSKTHDLLVESTWQAARLRELVDTALGHYAKPYDYSGPDLELQPNFAVTMGMALNELATNAVKHGAWSGAGSVSISVVVDEAAQAIRMTWTERGGPPVAPPSAQGFGSRLLQGLAVEFGGKAKVVYPTQGLVCTLDMAISPQARPV